MLSAILFLLAAMATRITPLYPFRGHFALTSIFMVAGLISWLAGHQGKGTDTLQDFSLAHPDTVYTLEGWVREAPIHLRGMEYMGFLLDVDHAQVGEKIHPLSGGVLVRWAAPTQPLYVNERIAVTGTLTQRLGPVNHGIQGYEDHLHSIGVHSALRIRKDAVQKQDSRQWSPSYWASRLRQAEAELMQKSVPESVLPFALTVWLGDRGHLSSDLREKFVQSGTAHILAVSGVHVGIIFLTITFLARASVRSRRARALIVMGAVVTSPTMLAILCYALGVFALYRALQSRVMRERNVLETIALPPKKRFGLRLNPSHTARWRRYGMLAAACLTLSWLTWQPWQRTPTVDFLDVGHGDAAFVRTPGGTTLLIDGGDTSRYVDWGERVVVPFLLAHGVDKLDYVVASHADRDHMGGLLHVLERLQVGEVILGPKDSGRPLETSLLELCATREIPVRRLAAGDTLPLAGATLDVLHPTAEGWVGDNINDASLVMHLTWPGMDVLFTGDIEEDAERLLAEHAPTSTILKVPHHGSQTSSTPPLLDAVTPQHAIAGFKH
jgi:beta-lactamase superfamily II metal-dependent hydrolase